MKLIPTWPIAASLLFAGFIFGGTVSYKIMDGRIDKMNAAHAEELRQREVKRADDERIARNNERQMTEAVGLAEQDKQNEIARIRNSYSAQLASLQQRADRKPASPSGVPQAAPACQGATGAELSRQDAGFLVGEAARADELRAGLGACYSAYDAVR